MTSQQEDVGLLAREDAIKHLVNLGFTTEEAGRFYDEPDIFKRATISQKVRERRQGGKAT